MSASIEKSLYIGILKTRFDIWDEVRLKLKTGEIVEGEIQGFIDNHTVQLDTEKGWREVLVSDIDTYLN